MRASAHFWHQRASALANIPFALVLLGVLVAQHTLGREALLALFASPWFRGLVFGAIASFCWHMRLGAQVVIDDYIRRPLWHGLAHASNEVAVLSVAGVSAWSLYRLGGGG